MNTIADVMKAIQSDDIHALKKLFDTQPELARGKDDNGNSPLLMSVYFGRNAITRLILDQDVRPNLFEACAAGLVGDVERLLKQDPRQVGDRSHDGWTPLHLAAFFGHLDLARMLLDAAAPMLAISNNNEANLAINAAAAGRRNAVVKLLIERGCPPDARASDQSYTALHLAANNGNVELIELLLLAGADRSLTTGAGDTPYDLAIRQGHVAASRLLAVAQLG